MVKYSYHTFTEGLKEFLSPIFSNIVVWFVKRRGSKNLRSLDKNKKNVPQPALFAGLLTLHSNSEVEDISALTSDSAAAQR